LLRGRETAVLGGDIYVKRSGRFEPSYENWYTERDSGETVSAFASLSESMEPSDEE
jgi:hypothetical protein